MAAAARGCVAAATEEEAARRKGFIVGDGPALESPKSSSSKANRRWSDDSAYDPVPPRPPAPPPLAAALAASPAALTPHAGQGYGVAMAASLSDAPPPLAQQGRGAAAAASPAVPAPLAQQGDGAAATAAASLSGAPAELAALAKLQQALGVQRTNERPNLPRWEAPVAEREGLLVQLREARDTADSLAVVSTCERAGGLAPSASRRSLRWKLTGQAPACAWGRPATHCARRSVLARSFAPSCCRMVLPALCCAGPPKVAHRASTWCPIALQVNWELHHQLEAARSELPAKDLAVEHLKAAFFRLQARMVATQGQLVEAQGRLAGARLRAARRGTAAGRAEAGSC